MPSLPLRLADRWLAPVPEGGGPGWLTSCKYAHRGLHGPAIPENSRAAFAGAIERGMGIECDIQLSSDGRAMVFHDFDLGRMTGDAGAVAGRPCAELAGLTLAGTTEKVPTLRDLLELAGGRVPLLIEIKTRGRMPVAPICRAVLADLAGYAGPHAIIGFDPRVMHWFDANAPDTTRGLSFTKSAARGLRDRISRHLALWHARPQFLTFDIRDLPNSFAAFQRERGFRLIGWTVTDREQANRARGEVDALIVEGEGVSNEGGRP